MTVIAADFVPINPYETTTLRIANGQRYDVIVAADQTPSSYYVRAVIQTGCPSGGANSGLGTANAIINYEGTAPVTPTISTPITNVTANICQDEPLASLVPYLVKTAGTPTTFSASSSAIPAGSVTSIATSDNGVVFQWYINNGAISVNYTEPTLKVLAESGSTDLLSNALVINQAGVWNYFVIQNQFFASHPMHVHGHDISVLGTGIGTFTADMVSTLNFDNPTRRDTVMLQGSAGPGNPAGYTVIGFESDNPGAWLMHCHIAWHVDGGLGLQFIETPSNIPAGRYYDSDFKNECSALGSYLSSNPGSVKGTGSSGLKARGFTEEMDFGIWNPEGKMSMDKYRKRYARRNAHAHSH
jgi:FtsP/CotA-like multicopper oxidase with cupredoxin domain